MTGAFVIKGHKNLFGDRNGFKLILVFNLEEQLRGTEPFGLCHQNDSVDYFFYFFIQAILYIILL